MKRFLIIDWGLIGDVLCTTPLFSTIKKNDKDSRITVLTKPYAYPILKNNPYIDKIYVLEKSSHKRDHSVERMSLFLDPYLWIFSNNYDFCIDLYGGTSSALITFLSRAKQRITIRNHGKVIEKISYTTFVPSDRSSGLQSYFPALCERLNYRLESLKPEFFFSPEDIANADRLIVNSYKKQVGIFVGASWEAKRWPLANVKKLVGALRGAEIQFYIILGPLESREFKEECLKTFSDVPTISEIQLATLGALIDRFDVLISNDSGPIHIARAVETPCIGLFGPNHPEGANLQAPSVSISGYDSCLFDRGKAKSCQNQNCTSYKCIKSISVDVVKEKLQKILFGYR